MLLVNRSNTALFAGISPYHGTTLSEEQSVTGDKQREQVLKAEIGFIFPSAPAQLELYLWPFSADSRPFGVYQLKERPTLVTTLVNTLLFKIQEAPNDDINESST